MAILLIGAAFTLWWTEGFPGLPGPARTAAGSKTSPGGLVEDTSSNSLYKRPIPDQQLLFATVEHFCVKEYHRDSCIHHLITCGAPCLVAVPERQRKKIFADYTALRKERGLPPLPRVPHQLSDDD